MGENPTGSQYLNTISDQSLANYKLCFPRHSTTGIKIKMKEKKVKKERKEEGRGRGDEMSKEGGRRKEGRQTTKQRNQQSTLWWR